MSETPLKAPPCFINTLRCPGRPEIPLRREGDVMLCNIDGQTRSFPIVNGTPILINEENSVFLVSDFETGNPTTMDLSDEPAGRRSPVQMLRSFVSRLTPPKSRFVSDFSVEAALAKSLADMPQARILIVGAGDVRFEAADGANIVYTDVALAPDTHLIADAHDIPFADQSFDAVFAVAVLEHVADPYRCVAEFQRVLVPRGVIYAATPFMQQVHLGAYDFTRFTAIGHRRLFRWFDEIKSGVANGPGMVVSWSIEYFLTSFSESRVTRSLLQIVGRFLAWPFLLFDHVLARKLGSFDCASAYYFYGRLRSTPVHDRDIVNTYKGLRGLKRAEPRDTK